ncbi:MAG: hypothetical protein A2243_04305 [Omnitrophica WOR_2 bacterium RIFOXYA2_FULL_38_17]|nr:MAG: hypothetical protein A2243_04305 [Omnitrophica WOR_2 bacterium RIFOXYA2_FULL_38_17]
MPKVNILPPELVSKIAAGEVIERPASVIKELLENSLDAGATQIELHLKDAGKALIHIKDNGCGIEKDDLQKIFLRHATSKISQASDLFAINTLGFRGEALYSIAAVSDVLLRTNSSDDIAPANAHAGWEIHVQGSKHLKSRPCSFNQTGTEIEIRELFFNTPARKKFLKSNTTEINKILDLFIPYTILSNEKRFLLTHQGKTLIDLAPCADTKTRIADILNLNKAHLIESECILSDKNISAKMIFGDINISRTRRDLQYIFVNGRPVASKQISFHLNNVLRLVLPPNCFGMFAVFLEIPPSEIDVNIHPSKREVKIKDEQEICSALRSAFENALMTKGGIKQTKDYGPQTTDQRQQATYNTGTKPLYFSPKIDNSSDLLQAEKRSAPANSPVNEQNEFFSNVSKELFEQKINTLHNRLQNANYMGTFINKFLLFETNDSILMIDQHAAAERITFEALITQMQKGTVAVQHLLTPFMISLTPQEVNAWEGSSEKLEMMGFSSTKIDNETIAIHTYPALLRNPERCAQDILAGGELDKFDHEEMARRACRASVMTGAKLAGQEIDFLRNSLLNCLDPFTCPHGRPTVIELSEEFLSKQFLRT